MKSIFYKNKKGSIVDPITTGGVILMIAATIFVAYYIWSIFAENIVLSVANSVANETVVNTVNSLTATYGMMDYMVPLLVGGFMIVSLIFAFKTGASVIYAFVSLISWGLALLMAAVYTNIFETFQSSFPTVAVNFPILISIMDNMKWVVLAWLFLISLVMFSRNKKEDVNLAGGLNDYYG